MNMRVRDIDTKVKLGRVEYGSKADEKAVVVFLARDSFEGSSAAINWADVDVMDFIKTSV